MNFEEPEADGINTIAHVCPMCNKKGQIMVKSGKFVCASSTKKECPMCGGRGLIIVDNRKKDN